MAKIGIFIDPDLDDDGNKIVKEPHHDEATSTTTAQASIADGVKALSEQKQLEADEERARRKIQGEEIAYTTIFNNRLETKLALASCEFKKALANVEKEEEDM